jgi:hypothetical protein
MLFVNQSLHIRLDKGVILFYGSLCARLITASFDDMPACRVGAKRKTFSIRQGILGVEFPSEKLS